MLCAIVKGRRKKMRESERKKLLHDLHQTVYHYLWDTAIFCTCTAYAQCTACYNCQYFYIVSTASCTCTFYISHHAENKIREWMIFFVFSLDL